MEHKLFIYGTLIDSKIQQSVWGRTIIGSPDILFGYKKIEIFSDGEKYPAIIPYQGKEVPGFIITLTDEELIKSDEYEGEEYKRERVELQSGLSAWVYIVKNEIVYRLSFLEKNKDIFNSIKDGKKKIETRAGKSEYSTIKSGDVIELSCGEENFLKTVKKVFQLENLESLLKEYKPEEIIPGIFSYEKIKEIYLSFPNYEKRIKENGIFVFELE